MNSITAQRRQRLLFFVTLVLSVAGCGEKTPKAVDLPAPIVHVAQPVQQTVTDYQIFTARTQAVQSTDIKARVTGYLTKILFKDGTEVKEGDVLFELDDRPYKAALDQAKANLDVAVATLGFAQSSLEVVNASFIKAQSDYDMGLVVQKQNKAAMSEQDMTKRLAARDEAKGNIDKAKANVEEAKASITQAKASVESAKLNYDWCKVTSPLSGRINQHLVDVGNVVNQNTTSLVNIVSLKPIWAYFDVDENSVRRYQEMVRKGEVKAIRQNTVHVAMGLGNNNTFPISGTIDFISNQLDANTGSIRLRAVFPNEDGSLVAGMFGRIRMPTSAEHSALLVADSAIGTNQGERFILVVNEKDEVEYRVVEVGQLHQHLREVKRFREVAQAGPQGQDIFKKVEVLKPTDKLVVEGLLRVRPGSQVKPKQVEMVTLLLQPSSEQKSVETKSK